MMAIETISNNTEEKELLNSEKDKFKAFLLQVVDDIQSMEELSAARNIAYSIDPTIMAVRKQSQYKSAFVSPSATINIVQNKKYKNASIASCSGPAM